MSDIAAQNKELQDECRNAERGCGHRQTHALYLESLPSVDGNCPLVYTFDPPMAVDIGHNRGFVYVDGDTLLNGYSVIESLRGPSLTTRWKAHGDDLLGMPLEIRMQIGEGKGVSPDALAARFCKPQVAPPRIKAAPWLMDCRKAISQAAKTYGHPSYLEDAAIIAEAHSSVMQTAAAVWRLVRGKRKGRLSALQGLDLSTVLIGLGLIKDGKAVRNILDV